MAQKDSIFYEKVEKFHRWYDSNHENHDKIGVGVFHSVKSRDDEIKALTKLSLEELQNSFKSKFKEDFLFKPFTSVIPEDLGANLFSARRGETSHGIAFYLKSTTILNEASSIKSIMKTGLTNGMFQLLFAKAPDDQAQMLELAFSEQINGKGSSKVMLASSIKGRYKSDDEALKILGGMVDKYTAPATKIIEEAKEKLEKGIAWTGMFSNRSYSEFTNGR